MTETCVIEIQDYKNMKLKNLSPTTRRKCVERLKFKDPKARYMSSVKLGRWDGSFSYCSIGGQTYINFLSILYPIIEADGYDFKVDDLRKIENMYFPKIDKFLFSDTIWPETHRLSGQKVELMDHQVLAVNSLLENMSASIEAATSAGKSLICASLAKMAETYGRTITVVPNRDLVDQTYNDFIMLGLDAGKLYYGQKDLSNKHIICTWQSLNNIVKGKKNEIILSAEDLDTLLDGVVMTIQDELHLATSQVLFYINSQLFKDIPLCYGMTGTIPKEEHLREALRANFGEIVYSIPAKELQDLNILAKCHVKINHIQFNPKPTFRDYSSEKKYVNTNEEVLDMLAQDVINMSQEIKGNTLVLVENIETGKILKDKIPGSVFLYGNVKSKDRIKEYKEVNNEDNKVIIATYGIASTGISINRLFNLVLVNAGKSFTRTIQSIGRGLRIAKDKDFVNIFDYAMNTKYSTRHLSERKTYYKESEYPFEIIKRKI
jgi:superfamily II DNA or RNA helicase